MTGSADLQLLESIDAPGASSEYQEWPVICALCRRRDELQSHQQKVPIREMIHAYEETTGTYVGCD